MAQWDEMKDGKQVRLHTALITSDQSSRLLYLLPGIFGSGRNWASVMRRFVNDRSDWACRLIDLRQHGESQGFAPPHTLSSAAQDLAELAIQEAEAPSAVLGHSFGGKVALAYARDHGATLAQAWIIDSTPDARTADGSAWQMLKLLRRLPREFKSRSELVEQLTANGIAMPLAQWMATNLHRVDNVYRWRFDLDAIEELLRDFFEQDLWSVVEQPPELLQIHFVKAEQSSMLTPQAIRRIQSLSAGGRVHLHRVESGHWVNADNPAALLALMERYM